jgi:hypothetical protein
VTVLALNKHAVVTPGVIDTKSVGVIVGMAFTTGPDGVIPDIGVHMADHAGIVIIVGVGLVGKSYITLARGTKDNYSKGRIDGGWIAGIVSVI